ncbi:ABC transporter ATP-binding protein [Spirosoma rhododendri]|uniref:sn-glycerol-3-phosphate ABC transporter ATP-binding protein UgpC n=1 Tax=Spirosoma rhododendri TaxID=2728024 RepID=A0A7L5DP50_9BACT|nr:sn-glycerol-3-phosphate ABC transporter ATP-binding protein UgpC [Spirosoma rhododendri]QJD77520.1 sn-glycerol-3-phosphate ABC transporter ATP-binding protein UgpC [Spirosoma rhododendri]
MANVTLTHIVKAYGDGPTVIRDVSIDVRDQEFVVLVGPSGCGKSTLLRMIAGLEDITSGDMLLDGKRINDLPPKDRDIAMVFQNYALYPHMTVFENMAFGLKLRNMPKAEIRERVTQAARILEIENLLDRKPKDMSGGQRQRVAIGRAIVREPKVFLFDEPLSNLDAKLRGQTRIELQKLHRQLKATMIYVTHDQVEAMTLGDRIVVLRGGDVMQYDTPLELYNHPANRFVAGFIGTPPMNFLAGQIRQTTEGASFVTTGSGLQIPLTEAGPQTSLTPYVDKPVTLGIRAEHLTLSPADTQAVPLPVVIDAVENMGNEALAYVTMNGIPLGGIPLVARVSPADAMRLRAGQSVTLYLNVGQAHFFDDATELVIR